MKKIFTSCITLLFVTIFSFQVHAAPCDSFSGDGDITDLVTWCIESEGQLTVRGNDLEVWGDTNDIINDLISTLWILLSIWAIIMIVYSGLLMTLSWWNDEKVKKWKDLLKWTLIWYIALLTAWWIVSFVISLIYNIASG